MTDVKSVQAESAGDPQREAMRAAAKRIDRINDWLHVGGALPPEEYQRLRETGITHVIDLREEAPLDSERLRELGIARRHVPVPDRGSPTIEQLVEVAHWVAEWYGTGRMYVHCKGGFGRAATMAVGLLVFRGSTLDDAVEKVRKARPEMRLNEDQLTWLRAVGGHICGAEPERTD
jgi:protein-tyrosine phosphatase